MSAPDSVFHAPSNDVICIVSAWNKKSRRGWYAMLLDKQKHY
jgi:hypothetical protein